MRLTGHSLTIHYKRLMDRQHNAAFRRGNWCHSSIRLNYQSTHCLKWMTGAPSNDGPGYPRQRPRPAGATPPIQVKIKGRETARPSFRPANRSKVLSIRGRCNQA